MSSDIEAWKKYPKYNWIYMKPNLCEIQKIKRSQYPEVATRTSSGTSAPWGWRVSRRRISGPASGSTARTG